MLLNLLGIHPSIHSYPLYANYVFHRFQLNYSTKTYTERFWSVLNFGTRLHFSALICFVFSLNSKNESIFKRNGNDEMLPSIHQSNWNKQDSNFRQMRAVHLITLFLRLKCELLCAILNALNQTFQFVWFSNIITVFFFKFSSTFQQ